MKIKKPTKDYIKAIREYLAAEYGEVKPEWELMIRMLADNTQQYINVIDSIESNGIYNAASGLKNPLLSTAKDLQASIYKIVQHLGISPYASAKIKTQPEDDTEDFIKHLID